MPLARMAGVLLALLAVLASGALGYRLSAGPGALDRLMERRTAAPQAASAFVELPEMVVNLRGGSPTRYLKIAVTLAVPPEHRQRVAALEPQVVSATQEFLRGLDDRDLEGSAGLFRLRAELRRRLVPVLGEDAVSDVLLRNILTQ